MKSFKTIICALTLGAALVGTTATAQAAGDAAAGEAFYNTEIAGNKYAKSAPGYNKVGCVTCHSSNLRNNGAHIKTGKIIGPMAASAGRISLGGKTYTRFTDNKKMAKWFKRNCNGVLGRECTPTEKDNFLAFVKSK
ncbi:MAG: DUF1924 domain-containing protein [Magnetovibrio sp.]|nr:DUF1924 domain-containing protein [Magnetovibrio sp.]